MSEKSIIDKSKQEYNVSTEVKEVYKLLRSNSQVEKGLSFLRKDNDYTTNEQIELTAIQAPTFQEEKRGIYYQEKLRNLGIENVEIDEVGNVFGIRTGTGNGPTLVLCAHLDTVFPEGTDTVAKNIDGKIYAPGIADDGRGLASVLTIIRALNDANIQTVGDLIIGATVGEEGLGDLLGVKTFFENRNDIDGFISIEPGEPDRIIYLGTGSKRYKVSFRGPGGHSFGNFGTPSPIHALGRAIAKIASLETPVNPKTTYNVGLINGGTSVNTIAEVGEMVIDLRSNSQDELVALEEKVVNIIEEAAEEENLRWKKVNDITVDLELVGNRPAGVQNPESIIVQASAAATSAIGFEQILSDAGSTDSNVPINLGIPAVTLGGGGDSGGYHTLNEYYNPTDAYYGVQKILLTILGLVGLENVTLPLLSKIASGKSDIKNSEH
ncbi:M20/M25/M40 family metallo-hydrolase [Sporosarcina limicola]|uniref:Acetylornithine deacetylase/succinyl-diaminopimelate desuccinylase-like protein n=1 Tax=Sporosarcina limicola TaxID=34101 RepID=A0A927RES1_9BACL|nr:M20/M25/M40 family metallo-hydrolase [Sporosarcina limicola]MBE1556590.1 acetylornithine deacetylase/succinyl-diaminopimelate desuccinylase-like protein [Sporosarcina limicola]